MKLTKNQRSSKSFVPTTNLIQNDECPTLPKNIHYDTDYQLVKINSGTQSKSSSLIPNQRTKSYDIPKDVYQYGMPK